MRLTGCRLDWSLIHPPTTLLTATNIRAMVLAVWNVAALVASPAFAEITAALRDNLCRCGTHARIIRAVERAAAAMAA